jgi:hypothetical protein
MINDDFEYAYYELFSKNPVQNQFYNKQMLTYVFDQYDFGSKHSDGNSYSRVHANAAYSTSVRSLSEDA